MNQQDEKPKHIFINGRPKEFEGEEISYRDVVELTNPGQPYEADVYTVTYVGPNIPDGTLVEGQSIAVKNGMKFDAVRTNRS